MMVEFILNAIIALSCIPAVGLLLVVIIALTSNGECYYCGIRLKRQVPRVQGKKSCGKCIGPISAKQSKGE